MWVNVLYSGTYVSERPCIRTILFSTKDIELELFQLSAIFRYSSNRQTRNERMFVKEYASIYFV